MLQKIIDAVIQAIIQGLTEFLPVSSSGHLTLYSYLTGQNAEEATLMMVILHLGTLIAVFIAFRDTVWALIKELGVLIKDIFTGKFKWSTMNGERRMIMMLLISLVILVPFYLVNDYIEGFSEKVGVIFLGICFLYTSAILFLSDRCKKSEKEPKDIVTKDAVVVGIFQSIALLPGISRSGSTIAGGLFSGFSRETAVKYSFILGIPTILGGCLVELKDTLDAGVTDIDILPMLVGFVVAAVVGICAIKMVSWLVKSNKFKIFAIYTFILGILVIGMGIFEKINGMNVYEYFFK